MVTRSRQKLSLTVCAACATLGLHALLFQSLLWGSGPHAVKRPDALGDGANAVGSGEAASERLILIDLPNVPDTPENVAADANSQGARPESAQLLVTGLNPLPLPPLSSDPAGKTDPVESDLLGDAAVRAKLVGLYQGQVRARIERAWMRPRSDIGTDGEIFRCTVKILQDRQGTVREVDLVSCNGTPRWQLSLASAIQTASPLPAPPSPTVYSDALTLTFSSTPFAAGGDGQGYEPMPVAATEHFDQSGRLSGATGGVK